MKFARGICAGSFDNFHVGHQFFLWRAKFLAQKIFVILARDENIFKFKKKWPQNSEKKRFSRLQKEFRDEKNVQILLGEKKIDEKKLIEKIAPDVIFRGFDQNFSEKKIRANFPKIKILQIEKYFPEIFKSSKFREKINF